MLRARGQKVFACKDERMGDFEVDDGTIIEVEGRSKKRKKVHRVIRDDVEISTDTVIPMWMLGFSY